MKTKKHVLNSCIILLCAVLLAACGKKEEEVDPHEGQVYLYDGYDWTWYTPIEGVPLNDFSKEDFDYVDGTPIYRGDAFTVLKGIDVSEHQKDIDWAQVAEENLDFAYVRLGRRGYTEGGLFLDENFERNIRGAASIGLKTGVYFFSQAVNVAEAMEEAEFVLDAVKDYDVSLPIVFDWEAQKTEDSRTKDISGETATDCAVAFCETIRQAGYEPCIYFFRIPGYYLYDQARIQQYQTWFALPCTPPDVTFPSFYYHFNMWQYSQNASIRGIPVETDLDYIFMKNN